MKNLLAILQLNAISANANAGLLVLRLWLGLTIAGLHGWSKLTSFSAMAGKFPDPIGVGAQGSLSLAIFAELVCGLLLAMGLVTRLAALVLIVDLSVAFVLVHKLSLAGPRSGELAFIYLAGFVALLIAGPGRFSLDAKLTGKRGTKS
jgi:putative oxidoreductase